MSHRLRYAVKCCNRSHGLDFFITKLCKYIGFFFSNLCLNILKSILKNKGDYYYFHIDLSFETNRLPKSKSENYGRRNL